MQLSSEIQVLNMKRSEFYIFLPSEHFGTEHIISVVAGEPGNRMIPVCDTSTPHPFSNMQAPSVSPFQVTIWLPVPSTLSYVPNLIFVFLDKASRRL